MRNTLLILGLLASLQMSAIHVGIIESQTSAFWAVQDTIWRDNALALGYSAEILPQSAMDNLAGLSNVDILVVSSGILNLVSSEHLNTIIAFVQSGRSAYIQSEYQVTFQGNITFQAVMDAINADFAWTTPASGQLVPMNISGELSTTPNDVTTLEYFNYGYAGEGEDVVPFLEFQENSFGFCYMDANEVYGTVITISDEDWAWNNSSPLLMQNILYKLNPTTTSVKFKAPLSYLPVYPNPTAFKSTIQPGFMMQDATIIIFSSIGEEVKRLEHVSGKNCELNKGNLSSGTYVIRLIDIDGAEVVSRWRID